jgi:hypothetical protein
VPRFQPLYRWIRELHSQEGRLPVMIVHAWVEAQYAQLVEREHIRACLAQQLPLLNVVICQMAGIEEAAAR